MGRSGAGVAIKAAGLLLLLLSYVPAGAAAAPPPFFTQIGELGSAAGHVDNVRAITANPVSGSIYLAESSNNRISEFTAWGEFVKAWGFGVDDGSATLQVCTEASTCQKGSAGAKPGQIGSPSGLALDAAGNLYVFENKNLRVQKFSPAGEFLLMFGGEVNKTTKANVCTKANLEGGDECGAGVSGTGNGQFALAVNATPSTDFIEAGSAGTIFVADKDRIQEFEPNGTYKAQVPLPESGNPGALAVDPESGDLYFRFSEAPLVRPNVYRLDPGTGAVQDVLEVEVPTVLATDAVGKVYVVEDPVSPLLKPFVWIFDSSGEPVESCCTASEGIRELPALATNTVTGTDGIDLYIANQNGTASGAASYVTALGPPPDPGKWPPPLRPPAIVAQFAVSVGTDSALLKAQINPRFWADTTYYVQYGTEDCSSAPCAERPGAPGPRLTKEVVSSPVSSGGVALEGLEAGTTYHYRFVAQSTGGGPVYGPDSSFRTPRSPEPNAACPNQAFRSGAATALPDCRAYEMVSPVAKNNGDIITPYNGIGQHAALNKGAAAGEKLTYSSVTAFADAQSSPYSSQYMAHRTDDGWLTKAISPPREGDSLAGFADELDSQYKAFSEDLSSGWLVHDSEPLLAEGAVPGQPNLYRRDDESDAYEALSTLVAPHKRFFPELQGTSADATNAIFTAEDNLTPDAPDLTAGQRQLYGAGGGEVRLVSVLPSGVANKASSSAGTSSTGGADHRGSLVNALSADGHRVFWTATANGPGQIFLRENPMQPQSAFAHGAATGSGKLTEGSTSVTTLIAARGKASLTAGSSAATLLETSLGTFLAGQPISGTGIPNGTTIVKVEGSTLTLSAAATATSASVTVSSRGPKPFAVGQTINAAGIPAGTTIVAVAAGELTLSAPATVTQGGAALEAFSECTEPAKACTLPVSGPESEFWTAAADGSKAIFTSGNANAKGLYEFRLADESTHLIAGGALGVLGASEDASRIYFASSAVLAPGASAGQRNLYLDEEGAIRFIAPLAADGVADAWSFALHPEVRVSRVSPDGAHVTFMSSAPLTGYDNADVGEGKAAAEVFLYDAEADEGQGRLICVSCNPSGARPIAKRPPSTPGTESPLWVAAFLPRWQNQLYASRVLAADGSRVFFNSFDALVPSDGNGGGDVYEWEAPGSGDCSEESAAFSHLNEGCVSLISSGQSSADSEFVDASADGSDIFFTTAASLLPQDPGLVDIYDARVGGGLPGPPSPPAACEGEACQGTPAPPDDPTPASSGFEGAGNVAEAPATTRRPCAKGKVRRHGRCVARKHRKRHSKRAPRQRRASTEQGRR